jgi:two-component system response regulator NreC
MFAAGVLGYVLRKASETELFASLRSAYHGRRYLDPRLSDSLADLLLGARGTLAGSRGIPLSGRELQVLHGVAQGFTSQDLAKQMSLSAKTVETYRSRIYQKLGLHTRADLVHYAIAFGLLSDEPLMQ